MPETVEPIPPRDTDSSEDSEFDGIGDASSPGRSFGLREAIVISLLSCAAAIIVAWLHL